MGRPQGLMATRSFFVIAMLCTAYAAMPADLVGSWTWTESSSDADSSSTEIDCTNFPDVSSGSGTVVKYGAASGTLSTCEPTNVGYNYESTSTVTYSAVDGSTTEAELNFTRTAATVSDVNPATATCSGVDINWASYLQSDADETLNQMLSICRVSRDVDTLKLSCRNGFGGARRRRRVAWSECPYSAPASSDTGTSESECISAHTRTLQSATCTKLAQPSNSVPRSSDYSPFTVVAYLLGTLVYIFSQERMMN